MTGQDLKNSILQLAIQGKLVAQDANDEPASVLLERIKAEKKKLVEEKKIKKEKPLAEITEDEKPFEIPDSWVWVRIGDVICPAKYGTSNKSEISGKIPVLRMGNIQDGEIVYDKLVYSNNEEDNKKYLLDKYDILFNRTNSAELVGKSAIYRGERPAIYAGYLILLRPILNISEYLNYVLASSYTRSYCKDVKTIGVQQCNINAEKICNHIIPLPPLSEQKRIVAKIEELMPLVDEYDKAQKELDALNTALPEQLKQSILQEAIMGKLGTNNPDDEPASELLKRIRKEKEQLIKDKKIKKEKPLPKITEDEKPFEIPDSWVWVRLIDLYNFIDYRGKTPTKISNGVPLITASNIKEGYLDFSMKTYISCEEFETRKTRGITQQGDLLFTTEAPLGHVAINTLPECSCGQRIITFQSYVQDISNELFCCFILSPFFQKQIVANASGMTATGIKGEIAKTLIIPLPPLAEQHRIVSKIENLFACIEPLAKDLK